MTPRRGRASARAAVAYSTPQELYEESLQPAFAETPEGEGVAFAPSFGSSGDQSRAVEAGKAADVVHLSLEPDMQRLVDAGLVVQDWNSGERKGIVQNSVVVFVTRPGNPEGINSWDDLVTGGVEVITPNPFTSGGARWNIMAAYGSQIAQGKSEEEALDFVAQVLENTPVQDASARDALQTFIGGKGDVLLAYENEAIQAQEAGEELEYVIPDETILIETPFAVTEDSDDPEAAQPHPQAAEGGDRRARARAARAGPARGLGLALPVVALRRPAPADGAGAGAGGRARGAAARRAVRGARRPGAARVAPVAAAAPRRDARDDDLRHARPGGGDGRRRADRRDERRQD